MEIDKIKDFVKSEELRHINRIKEQNIDQTYYDDTFPVSITAPFHVIRTGTGSKIVDALSEHIETANPQVTREPRKNTEKSRAASLKISKLLNHWVKKIIPEIDEAVKNAGLRGDGLFQIEYNPDYNGQDADSIPIIITALDPLYTYCDPYDAIKPDRVVKKFELSNGYIKSTFPEWNPKAENEKKLSTFIAFYDKDTKYMEADGVQLQESTKNIYGFTPFVHFYSGLGKKSAGGDPATMAVGRLRKIRGRLVEECEIESRYDSIIGLYANPLRLLTQTSLDASPADKEALEKEYIGAGATLTAPYGWTQQIYVPQLNLDQLASHLYQIRQALGMDLPPILSGVASGSRTSGRLEDISYEHIQKKWGKLITNLEKAIAVILGMGLRMLDTIPASLPITIRATTIKDGESFEEEYKITKDDIEGYYECTVKLNPEEAIEQDRKVMLYDKLADKERISKKRFLTEGMGKTEDEADNIIAEVIAEKAVYGNEAVMQAVVEEAMKQQGMDKELAIMKQKTEQQAALSSTSIAGRPSEARNITSASIIRQALGESTNAVRMPPNGGGVPPMQVQ